MDPLLLILLSLLAVTLSFYLAGILPYPIGFIILTVFVVARIQHLRRHRK